MNPYVILALGFGWWFLARSKSAKAAEAMSASDPTADDDPGVEADDEDPPSIVVSDSGEDGEGDAAEPPRVVTKQQEAAETAPPAIVPKDTAGLVAYLLDREKQKNWKSVEPRLMNWQRTHTDIDGQPLNDDGMLGPVSALAIAAESGTVPVVRYWERGSQQHVVLPEYKAELYALADEAEKEGDDGRAAQLRASAQRERGQGFGTLPPADIVELDFDDEMLDNFGDGVVGVA